MTRRVICISHTTGSDGDIVGRTVCERLGLRYVDAEIVASAAERAGVDPQLVADVERRRSLLGRFLDELGRVGVADAYGGAVPRELSAETSEDFRALIREAVRETANQGDVVIVAHAASFALAEHEGVLRVLVTASPRTRSDRLQAAGSVASAQAARTVSEHDAARDDYLKRFYRVDRELPIHYDLVLNTDRMTADEAAELVLQAAR